MDVAHCCKPITDPALKAHVMRVLDSVGLHPMQRHATVLTEKTIHKVCSTPHVICMKSSGRSYFAVMTRWYHNCMILVEKRIVRPNDTPVMIFAPMLFADSVFNGTVMDVEVIHAVYAFECLINDVAMCEGTDVRNHQFIHRLDTLAALLYHKHKASALDPLRMRIKRFFNTNQLEDLIRFSQDLPYPSNGIMIKPAFSYGGVHLFLTDPRSGEEKHGAVADHRRPMAKAGRPRIEVLVVVRGQTPDDYRTTEGSQLLVQSLEDSMALRGVFRGVPPCGQVKLRCEWNERFKKWRPVLVKPSSAAS
jgi:hypothetical protein